MQCWRCHRIILVICKGKRCLSMRCQGNKNQAGKVWWGGSGSAGSSSAFVSRFMAQPSLIPDEDACVVPGFFSLPLYNQNTPITTSFASLHSSIRSRSEERDLNPSICKLVHGAEKPDGNAVSTLIFSWLVFLVARGGEGWQQVIC